MEPALRKTLTNLQLEYVDLFVIDMPVRIRQGGTLKREDRLPLILESTWQQMEDVQKKGLAKAIGVRWALRLSSTSQEASCFCLGRSCFSSSTL